MKLFDRAFFLLFSMIACVCFGMTARAISPDEIGTVNALIEQGNSMVDSKSAEAYTWVNSVASFNETHKDSFVYNRLKSQCSSAKSYNDIDDLNYRRKIIGSLQFMIEEAMDYSAESLKQQGESITDRSSSSAYKWVLLVDNLNSKYPDSSIYSDLHSKCSSAISYNSIDDLNYKNKILADLVTLGSEIQRINSKKFLRTDLDRIEIANMTGTMTFTEDQLPNLSGIRVEAVYITYYSNGETEENKEYVDTSSLVYDKTPIRISDTAIIIYYSENGITKSASIPITVKAAEKEVYVDSCRYELDRNTRTAKLISYENSLYQKCVIPAVITYNNINYKVTGIGKGAFKSSWYADTVTGGKNIEVIESGAFSENNIIKKIDLSKTKVTEIRNGTFKKCTNLSQLTLNGGLIKKFDKKALTKTKNGLKVYIKKASNRQFKSLSKKIKKAGNKSVIIKKKK